MHEVLAQSKKEEKGSICDRDDERDWRIMFGNINGFPRPSDEDKTKIDQFQYLMETAMPDILGISEHGRVVNRLGRDEQPQRIINKWSKERITRPVTRFAWLHGEKDDREKMEVGGTGIVTMNKGSNHTIDSGEDCDKLGRWNWVTINGRKARKTTIISIYRPRNSQQTAVRQSAILSRKRKIEALVHKTTTTWRKDLTELVEKFKKEQHEIIIGGDFNDDLNDENGEIRKFMKALGLREVLLEALGKGPATYNRGRTTIDGIFCTEGIEINNGGYISFENSPSDHRWPWIDIKERNITGKNRKEFTPPIDRRATSKIPRVKKKFQQLLEEQISRHNLYERMEKLTKEIGDNEMTFDQQAEYETIEIRFKRAIKYADRNCRKVRRGKVPFSKEIKKVMAKIRVQKLVKLRLIRKKENNRPRMRKLKRYAKKVEYEGPLEFKTIEEANKALKESYTEYNEIRPNAKELRQRHIYEIAEDLANEANNGRDAEWFANKMIKEEEIKNHFKEIKKAEKKNIRGGVEKVLKEHADGSKSIITGKEEIAKEIINANKAKRLQAKDTPLRKEPLSSLLGEQMEYDKWEDILVGNIKLPEDGIEEGTRVWYELMRLQNHEEFKINWTAEEYIESWRKIDENKSSLPGIQAAHIKSIGEKSKAAYVISQLALLPLQTGYAPLAWQKGIDSMIPKKVEGECRPEKLRLILLFDARFNHNNKLIGKKMMEFAEEKELLAREQFGSRKNKSAIEHAVNKRLTLDFSRQFKLNCVYIANDAKSCYDRILLMVAYLMMRQTGLNERAAISSISTLVGMEMKIRTAHGISKVKYGGLEWEKFPHGIGQGNGYGPAIWALISSPLLYILREKGYGTSIESPITREALRMAGFSFVDDTDQCEMTTNNREWSEQLLDTQKSIDMWESLLRTTGGAIEPTKSDWTKLKYKWKGHNIVLEKHKEEEKLYMMGLNGQREELDKIEVDEARETLGVWQAGNGQEDTQVEKLKDKIQDWSSKVNSSQINTKETTTAVTTTIGKTVRYPLSATAISEKMSNEINTELRKAALGKMGLVRNAPVIPVEAPIEYGGLGTATNVYKNQMIDHSIILMNHGHRETTTGKLLRIALEALSVESGIGGDPGKFDMSEIDWVTERTWIGETMNSLNKHDLELTTSIKGLKTWTNRDEYLMERLTTDTNKREAKILNKVRMYLKVATFSDIVTADGREIDANILKGKRSMSPSPSVNAYLWPNVDEPTKTEKKVWNEAICRAYRVTEENRSLEREAVLLWDRKCAKNLLWSYNNEKDEIYEKERNGYRVYRSMNIRVRRKAYYYDRTVEKTPEAVEAISVKQERGGIYIISRGQEGTMEEEHLNKYGWILRDVRDNEEEKEKLAEEIRQGKATFVSDGSYKGGRSSAAATTVPRKNIKISTTIPGNKSNQSSYRGELGGILASIVYANQVAREKGVQGEVTMVCDNKGALNAAFGWRQINPRWQCYDLLCMIRYHLSISPLRWIKKHVKGHQDRKIKYEDLDVIAQANVDVDKLAKIELRRNIHIQENGILLGQSWKLYSKNQRTWITGNIEREIRAICYEQEMRSIWERKCNDMTISEKEWTNFKKLSKEQTDQNRSFLFKYGMNILPTKRNMKRRKHDDSDKCPSCQSEETTDHLISCKSSKRKIALKDEKEELENEIKKHTSKEIKDAILYLIDCFAEEKEPRPKEEWEEDTKNAVTNQWERGQRAFFIGFWREEWMQLQEKYNDRIKTRTQATTKIRHMIRGCQKLLKATWSKRNEEIHRNEESTENKRKHEELNKRVEAMFKKKKRIPNVYLGQDARIFKSKEDKIKRMKVRRKERWVRNAEAIMSKYEKGNERKEAKMMRSYFMPSNYLHKDDG